MASENLELRNEKQAAQRLGLSVATLRRRRLLRQSPAWVKLGARVLYRSNDLDDFVQANLVQPAKQAGAR
jgi:hypothetical protein